MISFRILSKLKLKLQGPSILATNSKWLSTSSNKNSENYEEVRIPVPWGHIAGKWWGPKNKRPILVLHGWQDNCGSFDTLLPLLKNDISYLAIDFPGHGLSSRFPDGMPYLFLHFPILLRRIVTYFKWKKVALMAHSLGGMSAYKYGTLYPEEVEFLINFDALYTPFVWREVEYQRIIIDEYLKFSSVDQSVEPPSYEMQELRERLHSSSFNTIDVKSADYLLKRNVKPSIIHPGKFYVTRDPRLRKGFHFPGAKDEILEDAKQVHFPICCIIPDAASPFFAKGDQFFQTMIESLRSTSKDFEMHFLNGTHHLHLNTPEKVTDIVSNFIKRHAETERNFDANSFSIFL